MVVSLSSLRNSAANFVFFDIQHQSSNSFSRGFTFLSKHGAFKNIFCFMFSTKNVFQLHWEVQSLKLSS